MDPLDRFEFSQTSLQDFVDCPQLFYYRHMRRLAWPAIQAEPAHEFELRTQRGQRFHRLIQQYLVGLPKERLDRISGADPDEKVGEWWQNFNETIPPLLNGEKYIEATLSAPLDDFRLVAIYDLILVQPSGKIIIFDWKTSLVRPKSNILRSRLQSRVYLYLLAQAGSELIRGQEIKPEQIEMIYWFAEPGMASEHIPYSVESRNADEKYLSGLVREIKRINALPLPPEERFPACEEGGVCRYCKYRSLCERGEAAPELLDEDFDQQVEPDLNFDFEQIAEVEF